MKSDRIIILHYKIYENTNEIVNIIVNMIVVVVVLVVVIKACHGQKGQPQLR